MSKPTKEQLRMRAAVAEFQNYVRTYTKQKHYDTYTDSIFMDDMLYGIGIALNEGDYAFSEGYERFKAKLREHLACSAVQHKPSQTP